MLRVLVMKPGANAGIQIVATARPRQVERREMATIPRCCCGQVWSREWGHRIARTEVLVAGNPRLIRVVKLDWAMIR
jgi:hypothetical protein